MYKVIGIVLAVIALVGLFKVIQKGVAMAEANECVQWASDVQ